MSELVGGIRQRLIFDSLHNMVNDALTDLGWFDPNRAHLPVQFTSEPVPLNQEIPLNTLVLVDDNITDSEDEMGSLMSEHRWSFWIDLYAETKSIGIHLSGDIKAILEGRLPSIGRGRPTLDVYDYQQATPSVIFTCEIEDVAVDRAHRFSHAWQKNWYSCSFEIVDHYGNEDDG